MTKKEFKELTSYHKYGRSRDTSTNALYFDWKSGNSPEGYINGFKYCVFSRATSATKADLEKVLYDFVSGRIEDTPYYIQLIVAETDEQRFKVPSSASGLNALIKR